MGESLARENQVTHEGMGVNIGDYKARRAFLRQTIAGYYDQPGSKVRSDWLNEQIATYKSHLATWQGAYPEHETAVRAEEAAAQTEVIRAVSVTGVLATSGCMTTMIGIQEGMDRPQENSSNY